MSLQIMGRLGVAPFLGPVPRLSLEVRVCIGSRTGKGRRHSAKCRAAELTWGWEGDRIEGGGFPNPRVLRRVIGCSRTFLQEDKNGWGLCDSKVSLQNWSGLKSGTRMQMTRTQQKSPWKDDTKPDPTRCSISASKGGRRNPALN